MEGIYAGFSAGVIDGSYYSSCVLGHWATNCVSKLKQVSSHVLLQKSKMGEMIIGSGRTLAASVEQIDAAYKTAPEPF